MAFQNVLCKVRDDLKSSIKTAKQAIYHRMMDNIGEFCYDRKAILGHGAFAIVFKGYKKQDPSVPVAIKCIRKREINKSKELLAKEIKVLRELAKYRHENVVQLLDVKETETEVYLMIEYCNGGDLSDYLHSKGTLSESTLCLFLQQIASALNALNDKGIVHRDMKPQNILLCYPKGGNIWTTPPSQLKLKIADFGFARFLEDGKMAGTLCGSPMYMAPEVIMSQKYDSKADLWSVGTIIFQCLTGEAPFVAKTPQKLRAYYEHNSELKPTIPENTSPELKDMLLRLLNRDATKRIGIKEVLEHPFLKKLLRSTSKRSHASSPIPAHRRTPSLSSEGSTPGSVREVSPLARVGGAETDMMSTLTESGSNDEDSGFTKVEKPDTRPATPEDFVLVPEFIAAGCTGSGDKRGKIRAPLAEEEYDTFNDSLTSSICPVKLSTEEYKVVYRREEHKQQRAPSPGTPQVVPPLPSSSSPAPSPPLIHRSSGSSAPIPVPSMVRMSSLSKQLQRDGAAGRTGSPARVKKRSASIGSGDRSGYRNTGRRKSETALAVPDITQVSPPAVQFAIGTPPSMGTWKRTNSFGSCPITGVRLEPVASNPLPIGSPLRRSASCSPGCYLPPISWGTSPPPSLPSQPATSTKPCQHYYHHPQHHPAHDPYTITDPKFHRYPTVPDCTALVAYSAREEFGLEPRHRYSTEPDLRAQPFHSKHILRAAFASHQQQAGAAAGLGALVPWAGSRELLSWGSSDKDKFSQSSSLEQDRSTPIMQQRRNSLRMETSPPASLFTASSPKMDTAHIPFVPPELSEDTLMDEQHNQTMARLRFILDVVDCVVSMARSKAAAYTPMADSVSIRRGEPLPHAGSTLPLNQRLVEQLVLYLRALQMIAQSINLAQREMKQDKLQYVSSLRKVLKQQKELYLYCIGECRNLNQQLGMESKIPLTPQMVVNAANKLIYKHAVEQCQTAALDELEGNRKECFHRYTTAQILLHSLSQLARNDDDRTLLQNYRECVELRLSNIGQSIQYPCQTYS